MINLPNVTLIGIDGINPERTLYAMLECRKYCKFAKSILFGDLPSEFLPLNAFVTINQNISSRKDNSNFILTTLHHYIETDFVMICQHDGYIINPKAWTSDFLKYDYIGAPWWKENSSQDIGNVGNGGFSIRSTKLLKLIAELYDNEEGEEDIIICQTMLPKLKSCSFAPTSLAKRFSWEGNNNDYLTYEGSFGFHSKAGRPDICQK